MQLDMQIVTRSLWGAELQASLALDLPYTLRENTTLNQKFGVEANQGLEPNGKKPSIKYLAIGKGGHKNSIGADGTPFTSPLQHDPSDAALFDHIPFVLREVDNDLSVAERTGYALRVPTTINGKNYFAYYLKRLDLSTVNTKLYKTTVIDGVSTTVNYTPTSDNLNPEKPEMPNTGVITTSGDSLSVSALVELLFTEQDAANLVEVADIMFGNPMLAVISEMALCSGIDKVVTGPGPGNTQINYNEVIGAQIATFISTYYSIAFSNKGFDLILELGATEPLFTK